jgi:hypothetical protein
VIKITGKNIMNQITGKAALLALSIISASAYASHWSYEGDGARFSPRCFIRSAVPRPWRPTIW